MKWKLVVLVSGYLAYTLSMVLSVPDGSNTIYGWQLFLLSYSAAYDAAVKGQYAGSEAALFVGAAYINTVTPMSLLSSFFPFRNVATIAVGCSLGLLSPLVVILFCSDSWKRGELFLWPTYVWGTGILLVGVGLVVSCIGNARNVARA
jgi:hypothetical protein